ncbi:MAG: YmdB family metallophosphoesterase, partial [Verrucomicrobia bacterium]
PPLPPSNPPAIVTCASSHHPTKKPHKPQDSLLFICHPVMVNMSRWLDGQVPLVVGTHTHVQTADWTIFSGWYGSILRGIEVFPYLMRFFLTTVNLLVSSARSSPNLFRGAAPGPFNGTGRGVFVGSKEVSNSATKLA